LIESPNFIACERGFVKQRADFRLTNHREYPIFRPEHDGNSVTLPLTAECSGFRAAGDRDPHRCRTRWQPMRSHNWTTLRAPSRTELQENRTWPGRKPRRSRQEHERERTPFLPIRT